MAQDALSRFDRVPLGHWPTPLEPMTRLSDALGGPRLFVKRDDCSGLAFGGNKVRKLEYLLADALAQGADTVITTGGVQSNHARQTAAAAARLGLACELVLPRLVSGADEAAESSGNLLLDRLLGARTQIVDDVAAVAERVREIAERARARGGKAVFIPAGGSTEIGALGFVRAALELCEQLDALDLRLDQIFVATSSGGTQAGLVSGLAWLSREIELTGVCVYADPPETRATVARLVEATSARLGAASPAAERIRVLGGYLGKGYGQPTVEMHEALRLCARLEGLILDPVYTGKAMAALIDQVKSGPVGAEQNVLFWHTGGAPALFAYPGALADADA